MFPQIIRLTCLVKQPTKSTSAGRCCGGPVMTRHCGLIKGHQRTKIMFGSYSLFELSLCLRYLACICWGMSSFQCSAHVSEIYFDSFGGFFEDKTAITQILFEKTTHEKKKQAKQKKPPKCFLTF